MVRAGNSFVVRHYYPQVFGVVKKYLQKVNLKQDRELIFELFHTGITGLVDAFLNYDPNKGVNFSAYCIVHIKKHVLSFFDSYFSFRKDPFLVSIDDSKYLLGRNNLDLERNNSDDYEFENLSGGLSGNLSDDLSCDLSCESGDLFDLSGRTSNRLSDSLFRIKVLLDRVLTPLESYVVKNFYLNGKTAKEILETLKKEYPRLTEDSIFWIKKRAIKKLKES